MKDEGNIVPAKIELHGGRLEAWNQKMQKCKDKERHRSISNIPGAGYGGGEGRVYAESGIITVRQR